MNFRIIISLLMISYSALGIADESYHKQSIIEAGNDWAAAVNARSPQQITSLYDSQAFLYATFQNMLDTEHSIYLYFEKLSKLDNLNVKFLKENIRLYGETAINSGIYDFSYNENGKRVDVPARYTFVYTLTPKGWMIVDHHSSVLPENQ